LQRYYAANRARYIVPEQRAIRFARIGADGSPVPPDRSSEAYYKGNQTIYGSKPGR
jgi:peptidyl-prolyl cis-trans isomerase D